MRNKTLKYRKSQQQKKQRVTKTIELLKHYSFNQWLETIRKLNINHNKFQDINDRIKTKPEFLVVATDLVIRVSKKESNFNNPNINQINYLVGSEIELTDYPKNLISLFGLGAISLLANWQNRFHYSQANMLGRMHLLYKDYNDYLIESINLSIEDIYIISLALLSVYQNKEKLYFRKEAIIANDIPNLCSDKIKSFLLYFSTNQNNYIKNAKSDKIYEKSFGKFKYLIRYPIIEKEENLYIIPVFEQFIDTISNNLYFMLLENYAKKGRRESKKFLDDFGLVLEGYVLELAKKQFGEKKVIDANKIVKNADEFRCEAVIINKRKALAIEVKKMYFKRDAIEQMDKEHIDLLLEKHIVKAYQQIENTLKYIKYSKYYGLIVIPDIMIGFSAIKSYIKEKFSGLANFDESIFICSLSSYEALMANSSNDIFLILDNTKKRKRNDGDDINIVMIEMINKKIPLKMINTFLKEKRDNALDKLKF
ncbi:hypothetical protein [Halarcobacter bivalviorum]|uniref:hypothetical protein n=1 Tax=Halarcobacter bivalviorum TaxID=663364 RepID=UPI00100BDC2B|nr:hypothetical protein [Halarcobacter bivalviorum]RXK05387.1 hypothetical protein CRU97_08575 [Halarcobacter bivalviorum]